VNLHFHEGTKIGKEGPVLAAKTGPGRTGFGGGPIFSLQPDRYFLFVWGRENPHKKKK